MLNIKIDSRKVKPGDVFVAIVGHQLDGHDFLLDAIDRGATKIITSKPVAITTPVPIEQVSNTAHYLQNYLQKKYKKLLEGLTIVGITGTNGKTTTTSFIYQLLSKLGIESAYIGTLGYITQEEKIPLINTTPDIVTLYELLLRAKQKGKRAVIMEVSSHALMQHRLHGIELDYGGFTNLTLDHLDYHKTMDNYLHAKMKILELLKDTGMMIVNMDDPHGESFVHKRYKGIGKSACAYRLVRYQYTYPYSHLVFMMGKQRQEVQLPFLGAFNMYNYLMAIAIVHEMGHSMDDIIKHSGSLYVPDGRCALFVLFRGKAIVDYAHTPDAVQNIITAMKKEANGKIITIIGCGGDRDKNKRPIMGKIVTTYSDFVIFTNDNPRTENPMQIIREMVAGASNNNYYTMQNRKQAIAFGVSMLEEHDILLILGKGHESYQIIGTKKNEYSDIKEIEKYSLK